jgi:glycosyltransferase involved in cell wall biosynthesis
MPTTQKKQTLNTNYITEKEPLVSILIPCYNAEKYIAETIDSVISQTYTNWECIIVDDHSTDNSVEIVEQYCRQYPEKIRLCRNPRKGACAARNVAFEKSKGEYIQYLDADDLLSSNKIEEQIKLFKKYGDKTITNCRWGRFIDNPSEVKWEHQIINHNYDNPIYWLSDSWMGNGMAANCSWLTPRQLIEKAGSWDESLTINQDGEFFCRVLVQAETIKFCKSVGVYYRSGLNDSITQKKNTSKTKAESLLKSFQSYERVLSLKDNEIVRKAIGNNYLNFMYRFYKTHPDLATKAEKHFYNLGLKKMWPVGGKRFKQLAQIIGFKNALNFRSII